MSSEKPNLHSLRPTGILAPVKIQLIGSPACGKTSLSLVLADILLAAGAEVQLNGNKLKQQTNAISLEELCKHLSVEIETLTTVR